MGVIPKSIAGHLREYCQEYLTAMFTIFMLIVWFDLAAAFCNPIVGGMILTYSVYGISVGMQGFKNINANESDYQKRLREWHRGMFWNRAVVVGFALIFVLKYFHVPFPD